LSTEMVKDISESSLKEAERLQKLIDQLLFTAKADNTTKLYDFQLINLSKLVNDYLSEIELNRPDVIIERCINADIYAFVDSSSIETALSNLVENAIKYANEKPIGINLSKSDSMITIKIADQGIGIPSHEKKHIFNKFYRIGSEETRKTKGTGLGLYICKKIVNDHGGKISVDDNIPRGSIFTITLPVKA
ncbi:MAG TPA: HAMP domain-containing sensor histidine kinase, partial [Saprospiraceae bacterium]|nr:HAMP domain-containing sensor histidine kinase [Saprospiraceae bacterium]